MSIQSFTVENAARVLRAHGPKTLLLLAGKATLPHAQTLAWRIASATGASILGDYVNGRLARGRGRLQLERVPYATDAATSTLSRFDHIILVNAKPPVGFFAYPDKPSIHYRRDTGIHTLSRSDQDAETALAALVDALGVPDVAMPDPGERPQARHGRSTPAPT